MERVEHLKNSFRHMLFHRYSRAESSRIPYGIEHDRDHVAPRNTLVQSLANLVHHGDIENIERGPSERDPRHAIDDDESDALIFLRHISVRSAYICWTDDCDPSKALKVGSIECEQMRELVYAHRGNETRVMSLFSSHLMSNHKFFP